MVGLVISSLVMLFTHVGAPGAPATSCNKPTFFGLVPWYQYLTVNEDTATGTCYIQNFHPSAPYTRNPDGTVTPSQQGQADTQAVLDAHSPFLLIGLAILDDLIRVAAMVAVGFVIYGGFTYATSQGSPDATSGARTTIINALIGLVIALISVGLVTYIGNTLGGLK